MAELIKEYAKIPMGFNRFCVRRCDYGHNLAAIDELFEAAKTDFPQLERGDVEVIHYAGERFARTFGVEFGLDVEPPEGYRRVENLERTF